MGLSYRCAEGVGKGAAGHEQTLTIDAEAHQVRAGGGMGMRNGAESVDARPLDSARWERKLTKHGRPPLARRSKTLSLRDN